MDVEGKIMIRCPSCGQQLRLPIKGSSISVGCPKCEHRFRYPFESAVKPSGAFNRRQLFPALKLWVAFPLVLLGIILLVWLLSRENPVQRQTFPRAPSPASWVTIPYGHLVDQSVITHSGETVGEVLQQLRADDHNHFKGLLQPYLEPNSVLCNENLPPPSVAEAPLLRNILDHYAPGSKRPVWADIAREGHFQVYYNRGLVRVFLKGSDPGAAFENLRSVVRHPIRDILHSDGLSVEHVEVYAFTNNYARTKIRLNTIPRIFPVDELNLSPLKNSLDLESIEALFDQNVALEATEIDRHNDLFFYGRKVAGATVDGEPVGISDLAAVYRAVFHHGYNEPYISLDRHEDNRYAKVNFGGLLENTRAGHVVLEADKLFKTLNTGLDPNTGLQLKNEIASLVPGFLLEDERRFFEDISFEGAIKMRYWFYPDDIGTVTNGSMGVVKSSQFLAAAERMDIKVKLDQAVRDTIDHLNANYTYYEAALPVYRELGHLGRLFALVLWLQEMKADSRVELDDLLSVELPAFSTPERTKKMLAVSAAVFPGKVRLKAQNIRGYIRTHNLSNLLDRYSPSTTDGEFLRIATEHHSKLDDSSDYPPEYRRIKASVDRQAPLIETSIKQLEAIDREIERKRPTLNNASPGEIHRFNAQVGRYNLLLTEHRSMVNSHNDALDELNGMDIQTAVFASVGGGINLNLRSFRQVEINHHSPRVKAVQGAKGRLQPVGKIAIHGDWVRNNPGPGGARINPLPLQ